MELNKSIRFVLLVITMALAALMAAVGASGENVDKSPDYKEVENFYKVMKIIQKNYVKDVQDKDLLQGAMNGMLQSLDAHSSFLTKDMMNDLQAEIDAEFGGLGIEITFGKWGTYCRFSDRGHARIQGGPETG